MNKILIISGSHRNKGASHQVAQIIAEHASTMEPEIKADVLKIDDLPFWDEGMWGDPALAAHWSEWKEMAKQLEAADGFIFISPEYAGMVPPRLMNFLLLCSGKEVGHKPALAVTVSASRGGAYPVSQLRSYGYKNNHLCWIPDHIILRGTTDADMAALTDGESFNSRFLNYTLKMLNQYATALKGVRNSGLIDFQQFPYGM